MKDRRHLRPARHPRHLPDIPPCDFLLIAGDICPTCDHAAHFQARWLDEVFRKWLTQVPARRIVGIAGNHDWIFVIAPELVPRDLPWSYLESSSTEFEGLKIWGSPWTPEFNGWAFNGKAWQLNAIWDSIPVDTDILVTHGPPLMIGDVVERRSARIEGWTTHLGCPALAARVLRIKPKLHVFGQIHEDRGELQQYGITYANVTLVDERYRVVYRPRETELNKKYA